MTFEEALAKITAWANNPTGEFLDSGTIHALLKEITARGNQILQLHADLDKMYAATSAHGKIVEDLYAALALERGLNQHCNEIIDEVATLTKMHDSIGDQSVVYVNKLGKVLEKWDPTWWSQKDKTTWVV